MDHHAVSVGLILAQTICFLIMSPILDTGLKISFNKTRHYARCVTNIDVAQENSGDRAHPGMKWASDGHSRSQRWMWAAVTVEYRAPDCKLIHVRHAGISSPSLWATRAWFNTLVGGFNQARNLTQIKMISFEAAGYVSKGYKSIRKRVIPGPDLLDQASTVKI